jgi:hypothetical protein
MNIFTPTVHPVKRRSRPQTGHSTSQFWKPDSHETELLDFVQKLILDVAESHSSIAKRDVALWLAAVVEGNPSAMRGEELRAWRRKVQLAEDFLEKFPDCAPAAQFLERFKVKFGYEYGTSSSASAANRFLVPVPPSSLKPEPRGQIKAQGRKGSRSPILSK